MTVRRRRTVALTPDTKAGLEGLLGKDFRYGKTLQDRGLLIWTAYALTYLRIAHFGGFDRAGLGPLTRTAITQPVEYSTDMEIEEVYLMFARYAGYFHRREMTICALRLLMWCHDYSELAGEGFYRYGIALPQDWLGAVAVMPWLPLWYQQSKIF